MTPRFVFHPAALAGLRVTRDWYERQRPGLGVELGAVIEITIERILAHPELYPEVLLASGAPCWRAFLTA